MRRDKETDGWTDRRTDMTELVVAFRNFVDASRNLIVFEVSVFLGFGTASDISRHCDVIIFKGQHF